MTVRAKPKTFLKASFVLAVTLVLTTVSVRALGTTSLPPAKQNPAPAYVAFGDSLTTGSSIATCRDDRSLSPWGCAENPTAATPYPNYVAQALHLTYSNDPKSYQSQAASQDGLYRAGIWGYTAQEAVRAQQRGRNEVGSWMPQLDAIKQARQLVTGSLGINDMHFSDIGKWARLYITPGGDHVTKEAQKILRTRAPDFNQLFQSLASARDNGAHVITGLYYNPYDSDNESCQGLKSIGDRIVNTLDEDLLTRSHQAGLSVADFRRQFTGHGAGSSEPYVFGENCQIDTALRTWAMSIFRGKDAKKAVAIQFDPHPNNIGTMIMANVILQEYNNAD